LGQGASESQGKEQVMSVALVQFTSTVPSIPMTVSFFVVGAGA
jgi:hypothetical protein